MLQARAATAATRPFELWFQIGLVQETSVDYLPFLALVLVVAALRLDKRVYKQEKNADADEPL